MQPMIAAGDAVMYMERAAEAEGVKGDEMGSNFVMGLLDGT